MNIFQRDVSLTALDRTYISAVEPCSARKFFLRESGRGAKTPHVTAKCNLRIWLYLMMLICRHYGATLNP